MESLPVIQTKLNSEKSISLTLITRNDKVKPEDVHKQLAKYNLLGVKRKLPEELLSERKRELKFFRQAQKSALYRKMGFDYSKITKWDDLLEAPTWNYDRLQAEIDKNSWSKILLKQPREWVSTTGRTTHKWVPWGEVGILLAKNSGRYSAINAGIKDGDRVLSFPAPSPFATNRIIEWLTPTMELEVLRGMTVTAQIMLPIALERGFDVGVSAPALWLRIAELFSEKASEKNVLTNAISRIKKLHPKMKFHPRTFMCGGTTTTQSMQEKMIETWGAPIVNVLASTESFFKGSGCYEDTLNCETNMIGPSVFALKNSHGIKFLHDCRKGEEGEIITYRIDDSLPLIGYETGDIVTVVQTDECSCGNRTPKIRFKSRKGNDPIDVNTAKIFQDAFTDMMNEVRGIKNWELTADYNTESEKVVLKLKYESYHDKDLENEIVKKIKTHPSTAEFADQAGMMFDDFSQAIIITRTDDELTKKYEQKMKQGIYKPIEFEFTESYIKRK